MSNRQTEVNEKDTALYERLSRDDELAGDSNSIINQDGICQGVFLQIKTNSQKSQNRKYVSAHFQFSLYLPILKLVSKLSLRIERLLKSEDFSSFVKPPLMTSRI